MKHDDLVKALADAGIPLVDREDMGDYTAKSGNLYLTWCVGDKGPGVVDDLHSTPYTGTDMVELPTIDYTLITYHKNIKAAVKRLVRAATNPVVPLPESGDPVKLLWIEGEGAEEFSDLIGEEGELSPGRNGNVRFMPKGRGDWLTIAKLDVNGSGDRLRVTSKLGLTYVFKVLKPAPTGV